MEAVITVATFLFNTAGTLFNFFMSNWVTSLFFVACILVLILDVVISSSSGDESK